MCPRQRFGLTADTLASLTADFFIPSPLKPLYEAPIATAISHVQGALETASSTTTGKRAAAVKRNKHGVLSMFSMVLTWHQHGTNSETT